jgi:two-component system cell cycle sensor histidine kinase/response regulator CckA
MKILIADDIEANRKLLTAILEAEGMEVLAAEDGRKALEILERDMVDAIISDILMPNVDGYRLCYEVRKDERLRAIPIVIYSASSTSPNDERLALEFGADSFVKKSSPAREIIRVLNEVTSSQRNHIPRPGQSSVAADLEIMKEYSGRLIEKLEDRNVQLERTKEMLTQSNRELVKRTEELKESEEKYRSIFENSAEGIFQALPSARIITANPAFARILGYESPEELTAEVADIATFYVNPEDREALRRLMEEQGYLKGMEIQLCRRDKSKLWCMARGRAVRDHNEAVLFYEGTFEDITERKGLHDQLLQSQKMEAVGRLAGGVAHDFNNLLTAIIGYSSLAVSKLALGEPVNNDLEEIQKAGRRAATLTNQLLLFSRRQVVQPKVLDINLVVVGVEDMLKRLIGEDIIFSTKLDPTIGQVKADPGHAEQVILNLAVNARDAMPDGGSLTIETKRVVINETYRLGQATAKAGAYVMLSVADSGHGMDEETQLRIFEPFFTTKEAGKGTGLGLSTVYGIVEQSGGNIDVHSEPEVGTVFKIFLPCVEEAAEPTYAQPAAINSQGSETILLVEDDGPVRKLAKLTLEQKGYRVLDARDAVDAIALCEQFAGSINLMITDVVMPGASGPNLASRFAEVRRDAKILYISGYTEEAITKLRSVAGGTFLQKPFTPTSLAETVRKVLDGPPAQAYSMPPGPG